MLAIPLNTLFSIVQTPLSFETMYEGILNIVSVGDINRFVKVVSFLIHILCIISPKSDVHVPITFSGLPLPFPFPLLLPFPLFPLDMITRDYFTAD